MAPCPYPLLFFFFFNDTPTTEIYTLSLHDALPICSPVRSIARRCAACMVGSITAHRDRKSTRLNSSHRCSSYAVFCLKKKKIVTQLRAGGKISNKHQTTQPKKRKV